MANIRTVHFSPLDSPPAKSEKTTEEIASSVGNPLDVLATLGTDLKTLSEEYRFLVFAGTQRHGRLQVMLSASLRVQSAVKKLLEVEEG